MRIRKRKVPLPLSLLSPVPLSDPHLFSRSPVMVVQGGATTTPSVDDTSIIIDLDHNSSTHYSQPSDHLTRTCSDTSASDLRRLIVGNTTADVMEFEGVEGVRTSNDDASNGSLTTARGDAGAAPADDNNNNKNINNSNKRPLYLSNNEGRWCDGDKAIPLKKRRGISFNNFVENSSAIIDDMEKHTITTIMSMKYDPENNGIKDEQEEKQAIQCNNNKYGNGDGNSNANAAVVVVASAKKGNSKRGNTIMEGSRCSRVNGRGWRCCQPTLVGYSLCEHHLGKGRLRSLTSSTSVNSRSSASKKKSNSNNKANNFALGCQDDIVGVGVEQEHKEKKHETMSSVGNKRVKLGVVKARSLSSLLGQTNSMNNNIAGDLVSMQQHEKMSNLDLY